MVPPAAILSHATIGVMMRLLDQLGVEYSPTDRRDILGVRIFCAKNKIKMPIFGRGRTYNRISIPILKQNIYERVMGTGHAENFLRTLTRTTSKDSLVAQLLLLDGQEIRMLSQFQTTLLNCHEEYAYILHQLQRIARAGVHPNNPLNVRFSDLRRRTDRAMFRYFLYLPFEIRMMIYQVIIDSGRVVQLHIYKNRLRTTCPSPAMLRVSRETRHFAERQYLHINECIRFNPKTDILYIGKRSMAFERDIPRYRIIGLLPYHLFTAIEHVALGYPDTMAFDIRPITAFASIRTLRWIHCEELHFARHHVELVELDEVSQEPGLMQETQREWNRADVRAGRCVRAGKEQPEIIQCVPIYYEAEDCENL